jgi:hypothetical protein
MLSKTYVVPVLVSFALGCSDGSPNAPSETTPPSSRPPGTVVPDRLISGISPSQGGLEGRTIVTITGSGFAGTTHVTFGGRPASRVGWSPDGMTVFATTPPGAAGPVDVVVTNSYGENGRLAGGFTYGAAVPLYVTAISPNAGPTAGGTFLSISGAGFQLGARVTLDGDAAIVLYQMVDTRLDFTTHRHAAGPVDIVVSNPDGQAITLNGRPEMTGALLDADHAQGTSQLGGCGGYDTVWSARRR